MHARIKTSVTLGRRALDVVKMEAARQRRSVSNLLELWIEDEMIPAFPRKPSKGKDASNGK